MCWSGLPAPAAGGRRAAGRVREVPPHLLLQQGVPDRGLEAAAQGGVQGAAGGGGREGRGGGEGGGGTVNVTR